MRKVIVGVSFSLLLAGLGGPAFAQQGTSEITGRAMDEQGAALPGVAIVVTNEDSGQFREATSSAEGVYHLAAMVPGPLPRSSPSSRGSAPSSAAAWSSPSAPR